MAPWVARFGGYGPAIEREPERVSDDVRLGFVSVEAARSAYGVVLDPKSFAVDVPKTRALRAKMKLRLKAAKRPAAGKANTKAGARGSAHAAKKRGTAV
jgi:hypothetical protein